MNSLVLQDSFEPASEGRGNTFASIEPSAVERALERKQRMEEARRAWLKIAQPADEETSSET